MKKIITGVIIWIIASSIGFIGVGCPIERVLLIEGFIALFIIAFLAEWSIVKSEK